MQRKKRLKAVVQVAVDNIKLNVGGVKFDVLRRTLCIIEGSLLVSIRTEKNPYG